MNEPPRRGGAEKKFTTPRPSLPRRGLKGCFCASVFLCLVIVFIGCGKKLPPVAPESVVPEPVKDFRVVSRDAKLFVTFTKPSENVDGSKLTDLAGFKIMRRVMDKEECKACPERFPVVHDIDVSYPVGAEIEGEMVVYVDGDVEVGKKYEYKVAAYNKDGYEGMESQKAAFLWGQPLSKPLNLTGKAGDKAVDLMWDPPVISGYLPLGKHLFDPEFASGRATHPSGYNIYRREEGKRYPIDPVNRTPVKGTRFSDFGLRNDRRYYYTVRAVRSVDESLIEGPSADEIAVMPKEAVFEELKGE